MSTREGTDWPAKFAELRPHQTTAVAQILEAYDRGARVVVLDAPTGSGKTVIAERVRHELDVAGIYVCTTKTLQDQFCADFDYARVLKGRANYTPLWPGVDGRATCADCDWSPKSKNCTWCPETALGEGGRAACPYQRAKGSALGAPVAVLNTSYFLLEANNVGGFGVDRQGNRPEFGVIDEADELEDALMGYVKFRIGERALAKLGLIPPVKGAHKPTIARWLHEEVAPAARKASEESRGDKSVEGQRWHRSVSSLSIKATKLAGQLIGEETADLWLRDYEQTKTRGRWVDSDAFVMVPLRVDDAGQRSVWRHADRWLAMSATIISPQNWAADLGLTDDEWEVVSVPMTFPRENRPIHLRPSANMTNKTMEAELGGLVEGLEGVLDIHGGDNILVHTVSYRLAKMLQDRLRRDGYHVRTYGSAQEREKVVQEFRDQGGVILAPSMERGVDLPGDLCRVVVVCKVPFPNLGDRQTAARMHAPGGQVWYDIKVARSLVQMTGRGVRGIDDYAESYILDRQFARWWRNGGQALLPRWWREAIS